MPCRAIYLGLVHTLPIQSVLSYVGCKSGATGITETILMNTARPQNVHPVCVSSNFVVVWYRSSLAISSRIALLARIGRFYDNACCIKATLDTVDYEDMGK